MGFLVLILLLGFIYFIIFRLKNRGDAEVNEEEDL